MWCCRDTLNGMLFSRRTIQTYSASQSGDVHQTIRTRTTHELGVDLGETETNKYYDINKERLTQKMKEYYLVNKEKRKEDMKKYYETHKDKLREQRKVYRECNKEKLRQGKEEGKEERQKRKAAYMALYYQKNKELIGEKRKDYLRENKEKTETYNKGQKEKMKELLKQNASEVREMLEKHFNIVSPSSWYNITANQILGCQKAQKYIRHVKMHQLLEILYPDYLWIHGHFKKAPRDTWTNRETTRNFLISVQHTLNVNTYEDWYRVSRLQMYGVGARGLIATHGRLYSALSFAFPEIEWDEARFSLKDKRSNQWYKQKQN
eukprot:TRINITY_DN2780_c0_g1_i2.p1 TRINITY_DN2780_c0_g1~~TRINITY_DN2780_c0_g1_i2.p1  ORF type:complete len:341 (-),score=69.43 TRINITY_DN2780_c0_g1_i2:25-987(-)